MWIGKEFVLGSLYLIALWKNVHYESGMQPTWVNTQLLVDCKQRELYMQEIIFTGDLRDVNIIISLELRYLVRK